MASPPERSRRAAPPIASRSCAPPEKSVPPDTPTPDGWVQTGEISPQCTHEFPQPPRPISRTYSLSDATTSTHTIPQVAPFCQEQSTAVVPGTVHSEAVGTLGPGHAEGRHAQDSAANPSPRPGGDAPTCGGPCPVAVDRPEDKSTSAALDNVPADTGVSTSFHGDLEAPFWCLLSGVGLVLTDGQPASP